MTYLGYQNGSGVESSFNESRLRYIEHLICTVEEYVSFILVVSTTKQTIGVGYGIHRELILYFVEDLLLGEYVDAHIS